MLKLTDEQLNSIDFSDESNFEVINRSQKRSYIDLNMKNTTTDLLNLDKKEVAVQ